MPLPVADMQWPPGDCHRPSRLYDEWGAWYSGSVDELARVYGATGAFPGLDPKGYDRPSQYAGGLVGRIARFFWGTPTPRGELRNNKLHIPVAGDIAATSADLLFGEMPAVAIGDGSTQDRLDTLLTDGGLRARLLEAAELAAAYGGVFLRVGWNTAVADHPLVDALLPDTAVPEWQSGHLTAVTFWRVVSEPDDSDVWRHLERHEPGRVLHGLYKGTGDRLGRPMPLVDHPATAQWAEQIDEAGGIATGAKRLTAVYVPNMRPHRIIRGTPLGRSDYAGVEPIMDAFDEAWTSWMRDLRLAKARLIVPSIYLRSNGPGKGASWDAEQEIYAGLDMMPEKGAGASMLTPVQFAIRVEEHERTTADLFAQVVRGAGYSVQTFGEMGDAGVTATEVNARERKSYTTRGRKIGYWTPGLGDLFEVLLEVDAAVFRSGVTPERPTIEFPDAVTPDPEAQARTLQILDAARAASIETKVRMLHPDWDDPAVTKEVDRIKAETGSAPVVNPDTFTGDTGTPASPPTELPA
ncbi:phage portal protein [Amycolatopsis taiwanensis]|uniref:phage portal protein n=1 Tax=Amycolatopsis taiwanensis TaxID=342230 RepID=UPI0004B4D5F0|nr:phage portal protein [Amycolatopsis taiwanensis]